MMRQFSHIVEEGFNVPRKDDPCRRVNFIVGEYRTGCYTWHQRFEFPPGTCYDEMFSSLPKFIPPVQWEEKQPLLNEITQEE